MNRLIILSLFALLAVEAINPNGFANAGPTKAELKQEPLANWTGLWTSEDSGPDVLLIRSEFQKETNKFVTRLMGYDVKPITGIPTTIWGDFLGVNTATVDRPELKLVDKNKAEATIINKTKSGEIKIELSLTLEKEGTLIIKHTSNTKTPSFGIRRFVRSFDQSSADERYLINARSRAREIVKYYTDSSDCTDRGIESYITEKNEGCVEQLIKKGTKVTIQNLRAALANKDFEMTSLLLTALRNDEVKDNSEALVKEVMDAQNGGGIQSKGVDGKYYSFDIEPGELYLRLFNYGLDVNKLTPKTLAALIVKVTTTLEATTILTTVFNNIKDKALLNSALRDREEAILPSVLINLKFMANEEKAYNIVSMLLKNGVNVSQTFSDGTGHPAKLAVELGKYRIIQLLKSADLDFSSVKASDIAKLQAEIKKDVEGPETTYLQSEAYKRRLKTLVWIKKELKL